MPFLNKYVGYESVTLAVQLSKVYADVIQMGKKFKKWGDELEVKMRIRRVEGSVSIKDIRLGSDDWQATIVKQDLVEVLLPDIFKPPDNNDKPELN